MEGVSFCGASLEQRPASSAWGGWEALQEGSGTARAGRRFRQHGVVRTHLVRPAPPALPELTPAEVQP